MKWVCTDVEIGETVEISEFEFEVRDLLRFGGGSEVDKLWKVRVVRPVVVIECSVVELVVMPDCCSIPGQH